MDNLNIPKITLYNIMTTNKDNLKVFANGLIELNNEITVPNKQIYYIIKYTYLLLGVSINSYYKDNNIQIKIPRKITNFHYNYFNHDNFIWNKVKSIKKINNFNGFLYSLKLKNNNLFLTDIGFIS